jgi:hypothetical protein
MKKKINENELKEVDTQRMTKTKQKQEEGVVLKLFILN